MHPLFVQDCLPQPTQFLPEQFIFIACQRGAEAPIKQQLTSPQAPWRLAFSRPGLITLKLASPQMPREDYSDGQANRPLPRALPSQKTLPRHPLIRQCGWVMGQIRGNQAAEMVDQLLEISGSDWNAVHVFSRDPSLPGDGGFEPGQSPLIDEIGTWLQKSWMKRQRPENMVINQPTPVGSTVLDVVLVEPDHWMIGHHQVHSDNVATGWPGGVYQIELPESAISRAYLKIAEAIAWSQLPIQSGDKIVEIGSSPGGAAQRLLDMGLVVTGVEPAEMDPMLLEHPRFTHWRAKSRATKRKLYRQFRWLTADANVAPNYTLDSVEDIVTYPTSRFEGMLLTLKLSDYQLLEHLEDYLERIRSWGFHRVVARQLAHNRRELCVVAQK